MPEELFWRTMNPARLSALFSARFSQKAGTAAQSAGSGSLSKYLMGG